ncbi:MAG: alpha/beta hydrolase, partial [Proteobacteria bacterium]|nr:alpha/beta hydrolase [Pseudomonadota bacterium]
MSARTPLVLLPGLLCDAALWRHQTDTLADIAEITVADLTGDDRFDDMARTVLKAAPETFALAGLSMGGYVAHEIMRQAPDRVTRLALLDTSARADTPGQSERRRAFIEQTRHGDFKGVTSRLLPMLIHPDRLEDGDLTGTITAMAEGVGREAFLRQQNAIMNRPDGRRDLSAIHCPT